MSGAPCSPGNPARRGEAVAPAEQMRPLAGTELRALLTTAAKDRRHHALLAVMAKAGLRPGEAIALQPGDVDFGRRRLRVERAVTKDGKAVRIKGTKTAAARDVDLSAELSQGSAATWRGSAPRRCAQAPASPPGCSRARTGASWTRTTSTASSAAP